MIKKIKSRVEDTDILIFYVFQARQRYILEDTYNNLIYDYKLSLLLILANLLVLAFMNSGIKLVYLSVCWIAIFNDPDFILVQKK